MKRKLFVFILVFLISLFIGVSTLQAQDLTTESNSDSENIGFGVGVVLFGSYSSQLIAETQTDSLSIEHSSAASRQFGSPGFSVGVLFEFLLGKYFSITTGIYNSYNNFGYCEIFDNEGIYISDTINIPLVFKVRWWRPYWMPYAMVGLDLGIKVYHLCINSDGQGFSAGNYIPRLGLNFGIGMSFDLKALVIDLMIEYSLGLNRDFESMALNSTSDDGSSSLRHLISFSIGFRLFIGDKRLYMEPY